MEGLETAEVLDIAVSDKGSVAVSACGGLFWWGLCPPPLKIEKKIEGHQYLPFGVDGYSICRRCSMAGPSSQSGPDYCTVCRLCRVCCTGPCKECVPFGSAAQPTDRPSLYSPFGSVRGPTHRVLVASTPASCILTLCCGSRPSNVEQTRAPEGARWSVRRPTELLWNGSELYNPHLEAFSRGTHWIGQGISCRRVTVPLASAQRRRAPRPNPDALTVTGETESHHLAGGTETGTDPHPRRDSQVVIRLVLLHHKQTHCRPPRRVPSL
jgi:hypothetical protein